MSAVTQVGFFGKRKHFLLRNKAMQTYFHAREPAEVTKIMGTDPRRITEIQVTFNMSIAVDEKTQTILERTAMTCPVFYSLHPDIKKDIRFNWK